MFQLSHPDSRDRLHVGTPGVGQQVRPPGPPGNHLIRASTAPVAGGDLCPEFIHIDRVGRSCQTLPDAAYGVIVSVEDGLKAGRIDAHVNVKLKRLPEQKAGQAKTDSDRREDDVGFCLCVAIVG